MSLSLLRLLIALCSFPLKLSLGGLAELRTELTFSLQLLVCFYIKVGGGGYCCCYNSLFYNALL